MKSLSNAVLLMGALALTVIWGCAPQRTPNVNYVLRPGAGEQEVSQDDKDKLGTILDTVAAKYGMAKVPRRQADMLRDYQPSQSLMTGLTAIVEKTRVVVQVMPLMPGVDEKPVYAEFKSVLEKGLQAAFGSRVSAVTE